MSSGQPKYALVTGASSGIGRCCALRLAAMGYGVVSDREEENRAAARRIVSRYGVPVIPVCMDLARADAAARLHARTAALGLEIEVLVCNAGFLLFGALTATPPERIERIVALHCTTPPRRCCAASMPPTCGAGAAGISS